MAAVALELEVRNPATLERVGTVARTRPEDVPAVVGRARAAQEAWWALGPRGRADVFRGAARAALDAKDDVAATIVSETAKPLVEALTNDVWVGIETASWLARNAERILRIFERAGVPEGLVGVVQGEGGVGEALVRAEGIDKILFTGSGKVGKLVVAVAAERLCPVTLELGGKDAMVVFADADLERAVSGALFGAFGNCGQTCVGVERIFVERARYEDFVAALSRRARALHIGEEVGPLISERQRAHVESLVEDARERGARIVTGGGRPDVPLPRWFYEPTLVAEPPPDARIVTEEIFGPAVTVEAFDGEDDAVRRANDTEFGLGGSVWSRDAARARRIARRLEAGMVWTNDYGYSWGTPQAPWGGVKQSGYGSHRRGFARLARRYAGRP